MRIVTVDKEDALDVTRALIDVALGRRPPDLRLINGRLVNVYSGETLEGQEIRICGRRIAYVGSPIEEADPQIELIDVEGSKVVVAFRGMCAQCRLTEFTMKDVVEAKLREFVSKDLFVEEDKESAQQPHEHRE